MRTTLLIATALILFTPKVRAQSIETLLFEMIATYFISYDELTVQSEVRPGLENSFFSWGARGGHNNASDNFTLGLSFFYSRDDNHGVIESGRFTNYHFGLYAEKKVRSNRAQKLYFSFPATIGFGESRTDHPNFYSGYTSSSLFLYSEAEILLNYGLGNHIQLNFGPGYRWCYGSTTFGLSDKYISGVSFQVGVRIGDFQ
jgi:hypothetical protein